MNALLDGPVSRSFPVFGTYTEFLEILAAVWGEVSAFQFFLGDQWVRISGRDDWMENITAWDMHKPLLVRQTPKDTLCSEESATAPQFGDIMFPSIPVTVNFDGRTKCLTMSVWTTHRQALELVAPAFGMVRSLRGHCGDFEWIPLPGPAAWNWLLAAWSERQTGPATDSLHLRVGP